MSKGDWIRRPDDQKKYNENFEAIFGKGPSNLWDPEDPDHPSNRDGAGGQSGEETPPVSEHDGVLPEQGDPETKDDPGQDKASDS